MSVANIGIVAGEKSGDQLGAELMASLKQHLPDATFRGVGGDRMLNEGLNPLETIDALSMNGFVEPLIRIPQLFRLLRTLVEGLANVDVMIGVDFNVFNFMIEKRLKALGIPTCHYVSPSVYAWRRNRITKIERSTDLLLTLFPFEVEFYKESAVEAVFVGHPLADQIPIETDRAKARSFACQEFSIRSSASVIALLPGSRNSEIKSHARLFLRAAERIQLLTEGDCVFVVPCAHERAASAMVEQCRNFANLDVRVLTTPSVDVFAACDAALVKSGTSTLEAMLMQIPMVVAYRTGGITYALIRSVLHTQWVALPNILTQRAFVPELLQQEANPETLAVALCNELNRSRSSSEYVDECNRLHRSLRHNASSRAAEAVLKLLR